MLNHSPASMMTIETMGGTAHDNRLHTSFLALLIFLPR